MVPSNFQLVDPKHALSKAVENHNKNEEVEKFITYIRYQRDSRYKQLLRYTTSSEIDYSLLGELRVLQELLDLAGKKYASPKLDS